MRMEMPELPSEPRHAGDERALLAEFLDFQRAVALRKVADLSDEDLRRLMTPTGVSLLGIVKHLAHDERWWFRMVFAGEDLEPIWTEEDPDPDWRIEPGEATEQIVDVYRDEIARSREIVAGSGLDDVARGQGGDHTLRWILLHMIEEVARHLGHADIIREALDGSTGD